MTQDSRGRDQEFDGVYEITGLPCGSDGKEYSCSVGDLGLISGSERILEKGMVTHSSILARRIPWTEEPGGLQSMGSERVGHDRAINTFSS